MVDAFWELSGWDGRFAATVRALVRHPGMLTREFLEGHRARYLSPLRLYLLASLLFFLVSSFANSRARPGTVELPGIRIEVTSADSALTPLQRSRAERVGETVQNAIATQQAISPAVRDSMMREIARAPTLLQPLLRRSVLDPAGFKRGILDAMPRLLFALVPVFAAIVAIFYRGRKYPEHLYFAIHLQAFVFIALSFSAVVKLTQVAPLMTAARVLAVASIPIYSTYAFRRTYGGSSAVTLVKQACIGVIYALLAGIVFLVAIYAVALWG
ncbi:MAG TPA: DUF3667 domain-containing protein [Gemmatimonadaceae bacterium]